MTARSASTVVKPAHRVQAAQQRSHDPRVAGTAAADLRAGQVEVVGEVARRHDDAHRAGGVAQQLAAERSPDQRCQHDGEVLHGLDRGVGVVDRRRHRLGADVGELADAERRVLLHRALEPHADRRAQDRRELGGVGRHLLRRGAPRPHERRAGDDVLADHGGPGQHHVVVDGRPQQDVGVDRLDVPRGVRRQRDRPDRRLGHRLAGDALGREVVLDDVQGVALGLAHHLVDLDRVDEVMDEEHQRQQAGEEQHQRPGDREPREVVRAPALLEMPTV